MKPHTLLLICFWLPDFLKANKASSPRWKKAPECRTQDDCKFGAICLPIRSRSRRKSNIKTCQCRYNCEDFDQNMVCAKTDDSYHMGEPTIFLNSCVLRYSECKLQESIPILCQGDDICGAQRCNLEPEYFDYDAIFNTMGKSKSTAGVLVTSHICDESEWTCERQPASEGKRTEYGICLKDKTGKKSCECAINRSGDTCSHVKSVKPNPNGTNILAGDRQMGYCGSSCNTCWMFGVMSMIVLVVVVALLVRRVPSVTLQTPDGPKEIGPDGQLVDRKQSIRARSRCPSNVSQLASKYNSHTNLNLMNTPCNDTNRNELSVKNCLSASSSRHEMSPVEIEGGPPRTSNFYAKRDSLSVPSPYGARFDSPEKKANTSALAKVNSSASLLSGQTAKPKLINNDSKAPTFSIGGVNQNSKILPKITSSSNFEKLQDLSADTSLQSRILNRRERAYSLRTSHRPNWDGKRFTEKGPYSQRTRQDSEALKEKVRSESLTASRAPKNNEPIIEKKTCPQDAPKLLMNMGKSSSDSSINTLNSYGTSSCRTDDKKVTGENDKTRNRTLTEESGHGSAQHQIIGAQ